MTKRGCWHWSATRWAKAGESFPCCGVFVTSCPKHNRHISLRLKVLKDEIRKPYFISLKEFLWAQGVKGAENSPKSLKVYPAREYLQTESLRRIQLMARCYSKEHLFLEQLDTSRTSQGCHYWARSLPRSQSSSRYVRTLSCLQRVQCMTRACAPRPLLFSSRGHQGSPISAQCTCSILYCLVVITCHPS